MACWLLSPTIIPATVSRSAVVPYVLPLEAGPVDTRVARVDSVCVTLWHTPSLDACRPLQLCHHDAHGINTRKIALRIVKRKELIELLLLVSMIDQYDRFLG